MIWPLRKRFRDSSWWEDMTLPVLDLHEKEELLKQYAEKNGHLVIFCFSKGDIPGWSWTVFCHNCKAISLPKPPGEMIADHEARLASGKRVKRSTGAKRLTYDGAKAWSAAHRAEFGLPPQDRHPKADLIKGRPAW